MQVSTALPAVSRSKDVYKRQGLYPLLDEKNLMMSMYPILTISRHQNPAHLGKNLYAYATELKKDPLDLVMDL